MLQNGTLHGTDDHVGVTNVEDFVDSVFQLQSSSFMLKLSGPYEGQDWRERDVFRSDR